MAGHYLAGAQSTHPLASPVRADLSGLPPLLIQVGSAEILLGDAVKLVEQAGAAGTPVRLAAVNSAVPFKERGEPEDIAGTIAFLASEEAGYITGASFRVDGGWSVISAG